MSALAPKRRLLLASDNQEQSRELERILQSVSEVHTVSTSELPDVPTDQISGIALLDQLLKPMQAKLCVCVEIVLSKEAVDEL